MTPGKWHGYPRERQILMIGSEFARAKNLLGEGVREEVLQCWERAFELLDLCAMDPKWRGGLRELLRFREMLGELYLDPAGAPPSFMPLYHTLMNWSGSTSLVEL
ncbi:MAG: hypothetical protein WB626_02290 [Bacteroidota bacterium]